MQNTDFVQVCKLQCLVLIMVEEVVLFFSFSAAIVFVPKSCVWYTQSLNVHMEPDIVPGLFWLVFSASSYFFP